ncbi:hypothetical protein [Occallatibacter riparius]|uniref:DinB family protein n=1 Tax=Occallatibacter riparius TaxID=1002689 RepID=A0A9J7BJP4_9BACT|nr:hypothetical protein [Occallatibacter riparius]UWZ82010.1 hypothetical protein MOP44_15675 [Occallatibacter riparius]
MTEKREFLRHTLAALAYRANRALEGAPDEFADFSGCERTPAQIVAHMGDLFDWALSAAEGQQRWKVSEPLPWAEGKARFFAALTAFDAYLAGPEPVHAELERLFQGPVADAINHVGQLAMMRRLAGYKIRGENFYVADMKAGRTGAEQAAAVRTF